MQANSRGASSRSVQQGWMELCERVASQPELTEELASLTHLLKLPLECYLAVHRVLSEGNWREAKNARAYIKSAAITQARKDDGLGCGNGRVVFMDGEEINRRWDGDKLAPAIVNLDRVRPAPIMPLKGKQYVKAQFAPDHETLWREEEARDRRDAWPKECWAELQISKKHWQTMLNAYPELKGPLRRRDWRKLGERVGLTFWQIKALEYRAGGISREKAMNAEPDQISRNALQAAWRYMDRTGLQKVRDYLTKTYEEMSRKWDSETLESEAEFPRGPGAFTTGNPLQAAWRLSGGRSREDLGKFLIKHRGCAPIS